MTGKTYYAHLPKNEGVCVGCKQPQGEAHLPHCEYIGLVPGKSVEQPLPTINWWKGADAGSLPAKWGTPDIINSPPHYRSHPSGIECIQITEHMSFNLGNVIKYLWRAEEKGAPLDDLKKARWYLDREIAKREGK